MVLILQKRFVNMRQLVSCCLTTVEKIFLYCEGLTYGNGIALLALRSLRFTEEVVLRQVHAGSHRRTEECNRPEPVHRVVCRHLYIEISLVCIIKFFPE